MCGIALVISGVRIDISSLVPDGSQSALEGEQETSRVSDFSSAAPEAEKLVLSVDDLKAALLRRGPDSLGSKKVFLQSENLSSVPEQEILLFPYEGDLTRIKKTCLCCRGSKQDCRTSAEEASQAEESSVNQTNLVAAFQFIGATLQLRGSTRIYQPMVDVSRNILVYNGEIFGGIHISSDSNDAEILLHALGKCCPCDSHESKETCCCIEKGKTSVPELLSTIKGPWALVYWQDCSKTIWFGRDAVGRRSLLVHWPTLEDSRLVLSSVSPHSSLMKNSDLEVGDCMTKLNYWEELSCGIYSISLNSSETNGYMVGKVRKHKWINFELKKLIEWERNLVQPNSLFCPNHLSRPREQHVVCATCADEMTSDFGRHPTIQHEKAQAGVPTSLPNKITGLDSDLTYKGSDQTSVSPSAHKVLVALRESVMRRTIVGTVLQTAPDETGKDKLAPMAILFSGGLDSMILAALLNECLDPSFEIELLNVSFDGQNAPDRITGIAGIKELNRIAPSRRWKLVEIDANLSGLALETQHVMSLIYPANTYMDLNIGIALWLAAGGDGWVNKGICNKSEDHQRCKYQSQAKVLLVGSGADEQCAGYGRHRTKYRLGSWHGLHEEMKLDMQRIWKRNLGRDDRCISDNGKEARYPFLDEDVIRTLLEIPLWEVANLDQPTGRGDKKILREVAELLGLKAASVLPKRAIQFGSRIARESNRRTFGSNRAANHASAGSVVISESSNST